MRKAKKINQERHSLRCDIELKLSVARKIRDEERFHYPRNLDFRGRAYPMHPHLNHLSSDLCRGILEFAEGRPLGKSGLHWLEIHLSNLYGGGVEKLPYDDRLKFVENHLNDILDSANNSLNGKRWWLQAEDPFQCLAACINILEAIKSPCPHTVISHLPIHQDGSCNGLQHYAALGRDSSGCCKPAEDCKFQYVSPTYWNNPGNATTANPDCASWSNDQNRLCYDCQSCKAGQLDDIKKQWRKVAVLNVVSLIFLIIVYSVGCCAFRNNRSDGSYKLYP